MYTVVVEEEFSAIHRLRLPDGTLEPAHRHNWVVRAQFGREILDDSSMVVDFSLARDALRSAVDPLRDADLSDHEAISGLNPTAEVVARYLYERLVECGMETARRVEVTEAPGCVAAFEVSHRVEVAE